MARSRNIKPGFCQNETLAELPFETRLTFALIPMFADREGRLEDRPKRIKMQLFPADNIEMDVVLQCLHDAGFLIRYAVGENKYIQIVNFHKHQNPHIHEQASVIPQEGSNPPPAPDTHGSCPADSLLLIPDSLKERDAAPPPTIWDAGVAQGLPRSLVGRWIKDHGEGRTAEVIAKLAVKRPADPVQFGTALLQDRPEKMFVPKDNDEMVRWAKANGFPDAGKVESYDEYRKRLWPLVKEHNARMST